MRLLNVLILFLCAVQITAQTSFQRNQTYEEITAEYKWVDAVFELMSEDERIGQLMMIRAHSDKGPAHVLGRRGVARALLEPRMRAHRARHG